MRRPSPRYTLYFFSNLFFLKSCLYWVLYRTPRAKPTEFDPLVSSSGSTARYLLVCYSLKCITDVVAWTILGVIFQSQAWSSLLFHFISMEPHAWFFKHHTKIVKMYIRSASQLHLYSVYVHCKTLRFEIFILYLPSSFHVWVMRVMKRAWNMSCAHLNFKIAITNFMSFKVIVNVSTVHKYKAKYMVPKWWEFFFFFDAKMQIYIWKIRVET